MDDVGWSTDERGRMIGPRVHDASVVGFSFEKGKDFSLTIERLDKSVVRLTLVEAGWFGFETFSEIAVNTIYAWTPANVRFPELREPRWGSLEGAWSVLLGVDPQQNSFEWAVNDWIAKGFAHLFYVDNDCGGNIAVLCRRIVVEEIA